MIFTKTLTTLGIVGAIVTGGYGVAQSLAPTEPAAPQGVIHEEDAGWDCTRMGNGMCGPDSGPTPGCYVNGRLVMSWDEVKDWRPARRDDSPCAPAGNVKAPQGAPREAAPGVPEQVTCSQPLPVPGGGPSGPPLENVDLVNINTATAAELDKRVNWIGPVLAKKIVEYRGAHGRFASVADLSKVGGIPMTKVAPQVTV